MTGYVIHSEMKCFHFALKLNSRLDVTNMSCILLLICACTAVTCNALNKATQLCRVILHSDLYIRSLFHGSFLVRNVIGPDLELLWVYKYLDIGR